MSVASSQRRKERFGPGRLAFSVQRAHFSVWRLVPGVPPLRPKTPLSNSVPSFLRYLLFKRSSFPFVSVFGVQRLAFGAWCSALRPKPLFQIPFLRFLCYLLFKRSSFPFVSVFGVQRLAFGAWCSALRPKPLFQIPFLRFLCYLLFKRSSFPFVSAFGVRRLAFGAASIGFLEFLAP